MLVRGGRLVDPAQGIDGHFDLRLSGARVVEIGEHLEPAAGEETFDATGCVVAPGFIDMHVHLRDPGFPDKETIATGTAAAAAGGFTAVACMPNTQPALDAPESMRYITARERGALVRVYPIAAITKERAGRIAVDFAALAQAGAVAFSDDGTTVKDARVLRDAALAARVAGRAFISHCEDEDLKAGGVMNLGAASDSLGLRGSPRVAEDTIVARDLLLAKDTGLPWHIAHLSTRGALALMAWARSEGIAATCEVTPHHLLFVDESVRELGARAKVNPPLREAADASALRDAVRNGEIDVFATDHAPHTQAEKSAEMTGAAVGFTGLEVAVGAYALAVPDLPWKRFVELLSTNPARVLGVPGGDLKIGAPADLTVLAERRWTVRSEEFYSRGKATPFDGMNLPRRAVATIVGGKLVMRDGRLIA